MKSLCLLAMITIVTMLSGCESAGVAAYHRGNVAYEQGRYDLAFSNYLFAANQGVTPAQYAVGYQYYYGIGTNANSIKATKWFKKAAPDSLRAQYALEKIAQRTELQPWAAGFSWRGKKKKSHHHK